jgi:DNA primase
VAQRERGGFYARLTERITFPIYSASGAIVGFGGRTITNHLAKYINSPQTKLFNKSRLLYGYAKAKDSIYRNKKLIVCEGYLDVIMFHQAGFKEAVATLGTALTEEHLPILRKGEPHIVLAYDGDKAGVAAALKAASMLTEAGFDGSVVLFPDGKDPADMIALGKVEEVANLLRSGKDLVSFVIDMTAKSYDLQNPRDKELAVHHIRTFLDTLSPIMREKFEPFAESCLGGVAGKSDLGAVSGIFSVKSKSENINKARFESSRDDVGQLSIIKTLHENRDFINKVTNVIEPSMFGNYAGLLDAVIKREENPNITGLSLDESIKVMSEEELKKSLASFLFRHYSLQLKNITVDSTIPLEKKSFLIRKIKMDIMPRLKRGELVSYKF